MVSFRSSLGLSALAVLCGVATACGSDAPASSSDSTGGAGATAGGSGGAHVGGSAGALASGGTGGTAGSNTAGANAGGSGGVPASGGTGGASLAGASGMPAGGANACPTMGTQADPGTDGDGKSTLTAPYKPAPETLSHLNNAPAGKLNGMPVGGAAMPLPTVYTKDGAYPGEAQMLKYEYWIYVPAQYKPGCAATLTVFQDGLHFIGYDDAGLNAPTVLDNLIASGDIPVTIGLFINPGEPGNGHYDGHETPIRSQQYDTNNDVYVSFLVNEFLPKNLLNQYAIVTDPDGWLIGGHSSGGIAAFMAGWYRPDKFRKLLTFDASFPNTHPNNGVALLDAISQADPKPIRTYLMSGPNDLGGWYDANTKAATELAAKNYHYIYRVETSSHYPPLAAQQDFANALKWMWRGYKL